MTCLPPHNEWNELVAAKQSEAELRRVMTEGAGRVSRDEISKVRRDAMRAVFTTYPDPFEVARYLETGDPEAAATLTAAYRSYGEPYGGSYRVPNNEHVPVLRAMGLVGWIGTDRNCGCCVGSFGNTVRRILLGEVEEIV
ncbi:MAG: hypothetical protein ACK4IS_07185 [Erythrobacter sp.]